MDNARKARNYVAHEGAMFFAGNNHWLLIAKLKRLQKEIRFLAEGNNLVSLWSYEIENKEPGPRGFYNEYVRMAEDWVFKELNNILEIYKDHPKVKTAEESFAEYETAKEKRRSF